MNAGSHVDSRVSTALLMSLSLAFAGCADSGDESDATADGSAMQALVDQYAVFTLEADLSHLSENDRQVVRLLIEAVQPMDGVFWQQAYGDKEAALALADGDEATRRFIEINYGPWDRLRGDGPFVDGVGDKPEGANFYPADMTADEFEAAAAENEALRSLYTLVRRDEDGGLVAQPYHEAFAEAHMAAAAKLREAAELASDPGLAHYLMLRAGALETDDYQPSDMAWLDMKDNPIDVIIGPIETYEDQLFGGKAAHEGFVLIKDMEWSERLERFAALLPSLQESLPVPDEYKAETPGTDSDLNAYDAVYYAGDANAGAKTIAINLPNDEEVQLAKGTRRLQLKNAMRAKFDKIMVGIAEELIDEDQRHYVVFDAFFGNVMFHEVAHGLGIKNTIDGQGTVREALLEHASPMEEGKADVVGLHMVTQLFERGELTEHSVEHHYVTFLAGIFRSVRFGAASAHGRANMVRFNYFREQGAFSRDEATGRYRVDFDAMRAAVAGLSELILTLQGDGNYEAVAALIEEKGVVPPELQADLDRLDAAGIPRDIVFEQGVSVLFGGS
ncbi:MAG: Zn-dependent hydrolase [Gemmatimonadota bacterium]|nr:Zn-dependent hydrolase [Gemmatimonadota bacterium]MDE2873249.1 Zn-dependent hydrolase [Gemmatimonadota bacterium]